jgi:hypothetical protein
METKFTRKTRAEAARLIRRVNALIQFDLTPDERVIVDELVRRQATRLEPYKTEQEEQAIIAAAKAEYEREGEIEIDDDAAISSGDTNGVYVEAWVFVRTPE